MSNNQLIIVNDKHQETAHHRADRPRSRKLPPRRADETLSKYPRNGDLPQTRRRPSGLRQGAEA